MVEWLGSRAPLGGPGFCYLGPWARTWRHSSSRHSSSHAGMASHMPQLERPTTINIQLCTEWLWREKGKINFFFLNGTNIKEERKREIKKKNTQEKKVPTKQVKIIVKRFVTNLNLKKHSPL